MRTRPSICAAALTAVGGAWPSLAAAAESVAESAAKSAPELPEMGYTASLIQMLAALALVLALVLALYWLARRFLPGQAARGSTGGFKILGRLVLGPRKGLVLVQVGARVLVLGVSEQGINALANIEDPQEVDRLAGGGVDFARSLKRASLDAEEQR
ncbi:MAG: flagellar biosynthetic protein FliO [Desulfarculus sp.]|nr:flagellar biosynthetic protein FliO [Desulfarculus sp.]